MTLATTATTLLLPYIKKAGAFALDKLTQQISEKSPSLAKILEAISNSGDSERVAGAAKDLANNKNPDTAKIFEQQLTTALQVTMMNNEELTKRISDLMEKAKSESGINNSGDGIVADHNSVVANNIQANNNSGTFSISNK